MLLALHTVKSTSVDLYIFCRNYKILLDDESKYYDVCNGEDTVFISVNNEKYIFCCKPYIGSGTLLFIKFTFFHYDYT